MGNDKQIAVASVGPIGICESIHHFKPGRRLLSRARHRIRLLLGSSRERSEGEATDRLLRLSADDLVGSLGTADLRRGLQSVADFAVLL